MLIIIYAIDASFNCASIGIVSDALYTMVIEKNAKNCYKTGIEISDFHKLP